MAAPCLLLGDGLTDDTLLHIASFLSTAKDLLCLRLSNKRFDIKCLAAPEFLCIPEEAGRRRLAGCSEHERAWVPRRGTESWLALLWELELLRLPLLFGRSHARVTLSENGAVAMKESGMQTFWHAAASQRTMRAGRHFVQFTLETDPTDRFDMFLGVIRPGWDVEGGVNGHSDEGLLDQGLLDDEGDGTVAPCCYRPLDGKCYPPRRLPSPDHPLQLQWEGQQGAREDGDRIGMLLDLDEGSMTIWKNDVKLGVMVTEGLSGPFCWAAMLSTRNSRIRIDSDWDGAA